jgi:hypothetical protein
MFGLRISKELMTEIAEWAEANDTNRSEAIRRLVELGLTVKTKARPASKTDRTFRAQELAARAIDKMSDDLASAIDQASRKRRLTKGPEEFREMRVDRPKAKK